MKSRQQASEKEKRRHSTSRIPACDYETSSQAEAAATHDLSTAAAPARSIASTATGLRRLTWLLRPFLNRPLYIKGAIQNTKYSIFLFETILATVEHNVQRQYLF